MEKKEYPATHSMWTSWFVIDEDGNVAIMECDENGPTPINCPEQRESPNLFKDSLIGEPDQRIKYTKEQLMAIMKNSISGIEFLARHPDIDSLHGHLVYIDPKGIDILQAINKSNTSNQLICISEELNLWYIDFSLPTNRSKTKIKDLLHKAFEDKVILQIINTYFNNDYYEEDFSIPGIIRKEDLPYPIYFIDHTMVMPAEKKLEPTNIKNVKAEQLPKEELRQAIKLPLKFKVTNTLQLARFSQVKFWGDYGYRVDGHKVMAVVYEDDSIYFVGNDDDFVPISIEEAFQNHNVVLANEYEPEYVINGQRGYFKTEDGIYYRVGSGECYPAEDIKTIEIIEAKKND